MSTIHFRTSIHNQPHGGDIDLIRADVLRARAWARKRFPSMGPDTLLDSPKFEIIFDEDRMNVTSRMYGISSGIIMPYRLVWADGKLYWELQILSGARLEVTEED